MMRWPVIVLIVGLLVAGVSYDRVEHVATVPASAPFEADVNPVLSDPPALSSVWYCPVGSAGGGYAEHTVEVTNFGSEPAVATVSVVTEEGPGPSIRLDIGAGAHRRIPLAELATAPAAGAVVEVISGQGVVSHEVATAHGPVRGACATGSSDEWHFAGGVTTRDATYTLALLNPFPEDAVFDVRFEATGRSRVPSDLQGAVVPARSVRTIEVGDFVAREGAVATTITLRRGQVVAERLQSFDGVLGPVGSAMQLGASTPSVESWFPAGRIHAGGDQRLVLYNPGGEVAEVDVALQPHDPSLSAAYGLVPLEISIGPGRFEVVDLAATAGRLGLPLPFEVGLHVQSVNGVPVVGERWSVAPPLDRTAIGADAEAPEPAVPAPEAPPARPEAAPPPPGTTPGAPSGATPPAPTEPASGAVSPPATTVPPVTADTAPGPTAPPLAPAGTETSAGPPAGVVPVALQAPAQAPAPGAPPAGPPAPGTTLPPAVPSTDAPAGEAPGLEAPPTDGTVHDDADHEDVPADEAPPTEPPVPAPTQPTPTRGVVIDRGSVTAATGWVLPSTPMLAGDGTVLVVVGVEDHATVELRPLTAGSPTADAPAAATVEVAAGERRLIPLTSGLPVDDLVVTATGRVVVAASLVDGQGTGAVLGGIPVLGRETS